MLEDVESHSLSVILGNRFMEKDAAKQREASSFLNGGEGERLLLCRPISSVTSAVNELGIDQNVVRLVSARKECAGDCSNSLKMRQIRDILKSSDHDNRVRSTESEERARTIESYIARFSNGE